MEICSDRSHSMLRNMKSEFEMQQLVGKKLLDAVINVLI